MTLLELRDLRAFDAAFDEALATQRTDRLRILGFGEITTVVAWPSEEPRAAVRRIVYESRERLARNEQVLGAYVDALGEAGVNVVATELAHLVRDHGRVHGFLVQELVPESCLATAVVRDADPARGHAVVDAVTGAIADVVGPALGIDGQLSNWAWCDGALTYLDVTPPMLRDGAGRDLADVEHMLVMLPAPARPPVRRLVAPSLLDRYHDRRTCLLDLCGNLIKERLEPWLPVFVASANRHLDDPITEEEARGDYRQDAATYAALQRLRSVDRWWQRRVRRRPYPYFLPHVER